MSKPLPETLRKLEERKQKETAEYNQKRDALANEAKARAEKILARSKQYAAELVQQEKDVIAKQNEAAAAGGFYVPAQAKVAFVIRIRGINQMAPQSRKILELLRLRQKSNAVFVRLNKATIEMLKRVEPYIAYGYPSPAVVRELIFKRGYARVNGQRIALTTNSLVQAALGQFGIESVEDLAHEIYTCGAHFHQASAFLWPFKLNQPKGGFRRIRRHYVEGGDYGNRENLIDDLITRMI
ncbi:60S ribosomal protein L7-2 [Tritrichomonas foetus]|uniref:60S ribosomal protein L7-2 n=1 Tax=Tritrichomonas foetus TaxID=1144522 RepID=A0A1J4K9X0_9EUKA|nr:60S ribosomal protein L7-2 [Tritrichomonas foetus]OHT07712.1 60S ribosomal protein L7-2 [Tritrichomonas foetus]|eukprot:OHT07712.1 60S ribosomal protein L7-2 [Tritrichomonas foetus]